MHSDSLDNKLKQLRIDLPAIYFQKENIFLHNPTSAKRNHCTP
jgi:hypothetical protein